MTAPSVHYIGQVERDPEGLLWAVLYIGENLISREQVRSLRRGRRRTTDMLLAAADTIFRPVGARRPATSRRNLVIVCIIGRPPKPGRGLPAGPPRAST